MEVLNNFSVSFTVVDHGFLVSTTKGERFAYETKEALHAAFIRMFGIEVAPVAEIGNVGIVPGEPILVKEKGKEPEVRPTGMPVEIELQEVSGPGRGPEPGLKPEPEHHTEPVAEAQGFTSVAQVKPFAWRVEDTHTVGKSQYQRKGNDFHVLREGYMVGMWISLSDLLHLKKNPEDLKRVAKDFASNKRTILTSFLHEVVSDDGSIATGTIEKPVAQRQQVSPWKGKSEAASPSGRELLLEGATAFQVSGLVGEHIGGSIVYRKEGTVAFTRSKCQETVYVREDRIEGLKALNRIRFNDRTDSLGEEGRDLLWNCLEDMKDDAMGCFKMISLETRPDQAKLDSISDGYQGE
jgi:hypothetical protein